MSMNIRTFMRSRAAAVLLFIAPLTAGCSSVDSVLGNKSDAKGSGFSLGEKFSDIFGVAPKPAQLSAGATPESMVTEELDCPTVDIRAGASTLTQSAGEGGALGLRYQATFSRNARECIVRASTVTIRVGTQGRVILGPAGGPGEVKIPLRYALVKEGIQPTTIYTKLYVIPVTVAPGQTNVPFTHVEEAMSVPLPPVAEFDNYVVYVGFDPEGAAQEQKKKPPPRRAQRPRQQ